MKSDVWHANRSAAEKLLIALGKSTPDSLKTLQDHELDRMIALLGEALGRCCIERDDRREKAG